jgi:dipeptidyl aminopeptidase/acylaminoacyl peptidase
MQVTPSTPPTWLIHTTDDKTVDVDNSIAFYEALRRNHVPAEMHLLEKGDHGFIKWIATEEWMPALFDWMKKNHWMK